LFQAEDGIRDLVRSRGLGDVYKRQVARLQRHVGHASISTTMSYFDIADEEQSKWYGDLWKEKK